MNKNKLKALIVEHDGNQKNLACAMGIGLSTLSAKINGSKAQFNQKEMTFIRERYGLSQRTFNDIFF